MIANYTKSTYLITCLCILNVHLLYVQSEQSDLYSPLDDVIRLNSSSFEPTVFHLSKNVTYVVQFYNTFCGHCQMFAPIYKNLASRVKNWTSVVRIAGVDCSKDENVITCSQNKVRGYPTIYIYPPNPQKDKTEDEPLDLRSLKIEWTVDDIEEAIVNYVEGLKGKNRKYPPVVEALQPVDVSRRVDFKRLYSSKNDHDDAINDRHGPQDLMFIVESDKSYLGRKLIMEYYRINTRLELRRILLKQTELLKSMLTEEDFSNLDKNQPILFKLNYPEDGSRKGQVLVKGEAKDLLPTSTEAERDDFIQDRFKAFLEHYYIVELKDSGYGPPLIGTKDKKPATYEEKKDPGSEDLEIEYLIHSDPVGSKKIFATDILKGITYMITHEIKIKGDLSPSELNTIRNLLSILNKYLPLDRWDPDVNKLIMEMRTRLDENRSKYEIDGVKAQEIRDILELSGADKIRSRYTNKNWVNCHDSDKYHKGYTCSLWILFHSLTVGEYMKAAPVKVRPTMVLFTMRDYITKFLGCSVCASNFEKETESLDASLDYRNSSALWLWNTHNIVRQRLNNESPIDKRPLAEVIFPSPKRCQECYKTPAPEIGTDGKTYSDIQWNMQKVLGFIIDLYKPDRLVTPNELALLLSKIKGKVNYDLIDGDPFKSKTRFVSPDLNNSSEEWKIQSIFSTSDMSICLFLYLSCIVIVIAVCLVLNPKWIRSKSK